MGPTRAIGRRPPYRLMETGAARWVAVLLSAIALAVCAVEVCAVEQAEKFVRGLHERGMGELALEYLERAKDSPLVGDKFRAQIPYHRGVTLVELSRKTADPDARRRFLDQAREELEQYAQANPKSTTGAEAQMQLAAVLLERGQQQIAQATSLPTGAAYDAQRDQYHREARQWLADACAMFQSAEAIFSAALEKLPPAGGEKTNGEAGGGNRRQECRARVAQLLFLAAQAQFEAARSYPPDAPEAKDLYEGAAKELAAVYEEFSRVFPLPGLYARLYEGRCYLALGQHQPALGAFEDIRSQPNVLPPLRKLIAAAYRYRAECLLAQDKVDAAIENCEICLANAKPDEVKQSEWLAVRYRLAQALQAKAKKQSPGSLESRRLLAEARDAYRLVASSPGEFQAAARTDSVSLGRDSAVTDRNEPRTFQEAYDRGKDALASYNAAKLAIPTANRLNPTAVAELETQIAQGEEDARRSFRLAMTLVDDDTDLKLVNEVRYFLCWLYWENDEFYHSAILGEFLARRYPNHPAASAAAKLSMASFERLYQQAATAGDQNATEFEARRMARMAEFITRRWPDSSDADAAFSVLVSYAIRNDKIDEARNLLEQVSESSRRRLELQLGNAMWGRYLELARAEAASQPDEAALDELKDSAVEYLRAGFAAARKTGEISDAAAAAGLYLVQAHLGEGEHEEAIKLLEDDDVGPLTLVARGDSAASRPQYVTEVYKAALRAYVSVTPPRGEQALAVMESLEAVVAANGGEGVEQLTRIYMGLGGALQQQISELRDAGREGEAERVTAAFVELLDRIRQRQDGASWANRVWVAQSFYNLGAAGASDPMPRAGSSSLPRTPLLLLAPAKGPAREKLVKARDTLEHLLAAVAKNPNLAPSEAAVLGAKLQLGQCYRQLGEYKKALDTFSSILREKESSLTVQRAAAYTYQARGQFGNPQWLDRAVQGGYRLKSTGKNRIWGWVRLSQIAQRAASADEKYWDTFFEARLNIARCRYLVAMKLQGDARRKDLARAKQNIHSMLQLYPALGGEHWRSEFDLLLKDIQKAGNEKELGLNAFTSRQS